MRHNQLERELKLILMLTDGVDYSTAELCDKVGISPRSLYYYLDFFRAAGFVVVKKERYFRLDIKSPFFTHLFQNTNITDDEAALLTTILRKHVDKHPELRRLLDKLERLFDVTALTETEIDRRTSANVDVLTEAIRTHNKVILQNYTSPHSDTVRHRVIEPFAMLEGNREVRAYEIRAKQNKTFKVERAEAVMLLADPWEHTDCHRQFYTDAFLFSGEQQLKIDLMLDRLAYTLLAEEYPRALAFATPEPQGYWHLRLNVCSYVGITRFVLGLVDDIKVLGDDAFKAHLADVISKATSLLQTNVKS